MAYKTHAQFYEDPTLYDELLWEDDPGEIEYYSNYVSRHKNILFLGPGTGRIFGKLLKINTNITGVEISKSMYKKCKTLLPTARLLNEDVLKLNLKEKFDLIIAPYEFVNHFNPKQLETLLKVVATHLRIDGKFIAQLKNPHQCINKQHQTELEYVEVVADNILEKTYVTYNNQKQTYKDYIERIHLGSNKYDLITMQWYYYFPTELKKQCLKQKLHIKKISGDFSNAKFDPKSLVLLVEITL